MRPQRRHKLSHKREFFCRHCRKLIAESCQINIQKIQDTINPSIAWYTQHKLEGLICPSCNNKNIYLYGLLANHKKSFICKTCGKRQSDSIDLSLKVISHKTETLPLPAPFNFENDYWDLRTLIPLGHQVENIFTVNFTSIEIDWFKKIVKTYIYHLCRTNWSFSTISQRVWALQQFSDYLTTQSIRGFLEIDRKIILNFIIQAKSSTAKSRALLATLRHFFKIGTIQGWFDLPPDLIHNEDFPKRKIDNPNPLSDIVREKIEENLHLLPDPLARMWIVAFFTAMRPHELALLKRDCLVQDGENWKVVWHRRKTKDEHEVPVTRTIARVIQQQQEYIHQLWEGEWDYLFCHYRGLSETDLSHPKFRPIKRVIPYNNNPLKLGVRCLLRSLNIQDENGQIPKFSPKLLRPTRLTKLFEMGHDLAVVSAWAGHKQLATTSMYYTHISCELIEQEAGHIQSALFNANGNYLAYDAMPKTFWENPTAHQLKLDGNQINTPIYGFCGLPLDQRCNKFRACYTCSHFAAAPEKHSQYIQVRDELRAKEAKALTNGHDVLVEQYGAQADQLDKIIASLEGRHG